MNSLSTDICYQIGKYLTPKEAVTLSMVGKEVRHNSFPMLRHHFLQAYGNYNGEQWPEIGIITRLLCMVGLPYETDMQPKAIQAKWAALSDSDRVCGLCIQLLQETQTTSILQLKHQLASFWHLDNFMHTHGDLPAGEDPQITLVEEDRPLSHEIRATRTWAKIGGFSANDTVYEVIAFYTAHQASIATVHKADSYTLRNAEDLYPHFRVMIGREETDRFGMISDETAGDHGWKAVSSQRRHVWVSRISYRPDNHDDKYGSDRFLCQKLTQIMIEVLMQNKNILSLWACGEYSDSAILFAAGFNSNLERLKEWPTEFCAQLELFRSNPANKLFPPYEDYGSMNAVFEPTRYETECVRFSREAATSWSEIIARGPVLSPNSAVLPEFWVKPPKFDDAS